VQLLGKAKLPISTAPFLLFIVTEVSLEHFSKACMPIEVTLFGIVTEVRMSQEKKAELPIEVTLFGIVTEVRLSQ